MEQKEKVLEFIEKMEIEAQSLVNRGVRYYAKPATEVLEFTKLALLVVRDLSDMYDIWAKTPCDYEAIRFFAEKLKSHYPHTQSICSTIDKELAAFCEKHTPAIALEKAKEQLIEWLISNSDADLCEYCSKGKETLEFQQKNQDGGAFCPYNETALCINQNPASICRRFMLEFFIQKGQKENIAESPQGEPEDCYEDPGAHTCDYSAAGECQICGAIRPGSMLYLEIYGGE